MNKKIMACAVAMILFVIIAALGVKQLSLDDTSIPYNYKEKLFIEDAVATVNIDIAAEDWADMLENPLDEDYKEASITINGETVHNVAVRTKGNSSLSMVASSDSDRYSLKVDFDQYDSTQSFHGLRTLNLNNNISDSSQMRDFISYEMFEQMGITVPAHSYMNVTINGEPYGLLLGVENIDETYIANNYNTSAGYLFKPDGVGSDLQYISDDFNDYEGVEVKMNEDTVQHSNFIAFIEAINSGENVEDYVDVDEMLRYFAMNTALVSLDSYQGQMKHNYYLYENEDGIMSILPWDYNMAFGGFGINMGGMPTRAQNTTPSNDTATLDGAGDNAEAAAKYAQQQNMPQMPSGNGENAAPSENIGQMPPSGRTPPSGEMPDGAPSSTGAQMPPSTDEATTNNTAGDVATMPSLPTTENDDATDPSRNMPAMGGGMMMDSELMNDSAIHFSISTPVSGASLEERPLLNVLLSNDEYRATYEAYLQDIATTIFTEENVLALTTTLETLLSNYVEADPSKFYTTDEFHENVKGDNSLPAFAAARSASILAQLSGEEVATTVSAEQSDVAATPNAQMPVSDTSRMPSFDVTSMSDDEFQELIRNIPLTLPENFDTMTNEEQRETVRELLDTTVGGNNMPTSGDMPDFGEGGPNFGGGGPGNMANRSDEEVLNADPMKTVYQYGFFLALAVIALLIVRNLRRR